MVQYGILLMVVVVKINRIVSLCLRKDVEEDGEGIHWLSRLIVMTHGVSCIF